MDEQYFLSEAYADLKAKHETLQAFYIRANIENKIFKGVYEAIIVNSTGDIKEFISEAHNDLIDRYAKRKANMNAIVEENRLLRKLLLKNNYLTGVTPP